MRLLRALGDGKGVRLLMQFRPGVGKVRQKVSLQTRKPRTLLGARRPQF